MQLREGERHGGGDGQKKFKRKGGSKSRLLQKVKKFGKQGKLGRGFEIDSDTYDYFCRVLELWQKQDFADEDEKDSFVENSFSQTEGSEVNYSSNQMTSRIIETILPFASEGVIIRFATSFTPSLRTICADPFASHVLEKLLEITSSDKWSDNQKMSEWFKQTTKYVLNNLEEFTFDQYANHIMRKSFQCLSGNVTRSGQTPFLTSGINSNNVDLPNKNKKEPTATTASNGDYVYGQRKQNKQYRKILEEFFVRFINWPQFFDLFESEITCGLVQALLKSVHLIDPVAVQAGVDTTLKAFGDELDLTDAKTANLGTRVMEACLSIADAKYWNVIYEGYFKDKLESFGTHEKGRFSLKKLMETCPTKEKFEEIFDGLNPSFEDLFKAGHTSLFPSLAENCKKYQTRQNVFLQSILSMLGYDESGKNAQSENFIQYLARFGQTLKLKDDGTPMYITDFAGTVTLQHLIEFHKPTKVISSFMEMDGQALSKLAQDPKGSHIVDTFFQSATVGEKNKEKLLQKLKEYLISLALNKFGSRVIDGIWAWANIKNKTVVATALSERIAQLNANRFGKFIAEKCALHAFKRDSKVWAESIGKSSKRQQESEDILNELTEETPSKKNKKRKSMKEEIKEEPMEEEMEAEEETPRKKKKSKKDKSRIEEELIAEQAEEEEEPKQKKKKNKRKSAVEDADETLEQSQIDDEEPKRKKKKGRKSGIDA